MKNNSQKLGEEPVLKLLWSFSAPAIVGMIVNAIYNVVDRIFVGQAVGDKALAALSFVYPFMTAIMAAGMLVGLGGTSLVAISLGQGNRKRAESIINNVCVFAIILELIVAALGYIFLKPLLRLFGTPEGIIMDYACDYMLIILAGAVFQGVGFSLNAIIRSEGNPKMAMVSMLAGAITNIVFDWLLTMVIRMGVIGAAIATILGQLATMLWVLFYFTKKSSLRLNLKGFRPDFSLISKTMFLGLSPALVQFAMATVNIIYNNLLISYGNAELGAGSGDIAVSAFAVYNSAMTLAIMPIFGFNQGVQPIVGYNYGARKYDRVQKAMKYGVAAATVFVVIGFTIIHLFPEQIVRAFNSSPQLIKLGRQALITNSMALPLVGAQIICSNYFQYINRPRAATFFSLSRQCLFLIPALFIMPRFFGLDGIFYAQPVSDLISAAISISCACIALSRLGKEA
ncbi:MAG: MATE family efflux transporter [Clostridia bacterium]|nr:MATE family efflux transporter [Clostridia bacterium]MBR6524267.1 MATE family efflux transporter [Clostridia bacterium]